MVEPLFVLAYFAFEPFWKLPEVINELAVEILNAPLNLTFVLWIRGMRKMRFNMMLTAPVLPLLLELSFNMVLGRLASNFDVSEKDTFLPKTHIHTF